MVAQTVRSYNLMAKTLHWVFIGVFAYGVINQIDEVEELADSKLLAEEILFAVVFLALLFFRFV